MTALIFILVSLFLVVGMPVAFSLGVVGLSGLFALEGSGALAVHHSGVHHLHFSGRFFGSSLHHPHYAAHHLPDFAGHWYRPGLVCRHHDHQYGICPDHATGGAESIRDQGRGRRCLTDGGFSGHVALHAADVGRPGPGYNFPPAFALASFYGALTHLKRLTEICLYQ